jgi:hypothetical protein
LTRSRGLEFNPNAQILLLGLSINIFGGGQILYG